MIEFDYDRIVQPNVVVHCDTEEKAINLLKWADSVGLKWCNKKSYLECNYYYMHREETCYNLYYNTYTDYNFYKYNHYKIYKYEDVIMNKIKDGWYHIKLNQSKEIEDVLPPTRCVYIMNNIARPHNFYDEYVFNVTEEMIESPAYFIGKEYEFSDNKKKWVKDIYISYIGFGFESGYFHQAYNSVYEHIREIKEPDIEINVKINGKEVKLSEISEETLLKIRQCS
jgi:hypothetical protein